MLWCHKFVYLCTAELDHMSSSVCFFCFRVREFHTSPVLDLNKCWCFWMMLKESSCSAVFTCSLKKVHCFDKTVHLFNSNVCIFPGERCDGPFHFFFISYLFLWNEKAVLVSIHRQSPKPIKIYRGISKMNGSLGLPPQSSIERKNMP